MTTKASISIGSRQKVTIFNGGDPEPEDRFSKTSKRKKMGIIVSPMKKKGPLNKVRKSPMRVKSSSVDVRQKMNKNTLQNLY